MGKNYRFKTEEDDVSTSGAEMEGVNLSSPEPGPSTPTTISSILDLYTARSVSVSSARSTGTTDTGDTVMEQGSLGGPPVSEWVFDPDIQNALDNHTKWCDEHDAHPTDIIPTEDEEIFCECNGHDDGSPMIKCDNGSTCLKEWFHMNCIGMEPPGPKGLKWYCRRCLYFERGDVKEFKHRMNLPFTKEILAADQARAWQKAEAARMSEHELPIIAEVGNIMEELNVKSNFQLSGPIPEVDLLAHTTDPTARAALFTMDPDTPNQCAQQKKKKRKLKRKRATVRREKSELLGTSDRPDSGYTSQDQEHHSDEEADEPQSPGPLLAHRQQSPYESRFKPAFHTAKSWSGAEENALIGIMRTLLLKCGQPKLTTNELFDKVMEEMQKAGYDRGVSGIRQYWTRHLREVAGVDERRPMNRPL